MVAIFQCIPPPSCEIQWATRDLNTGLLLPDSALYSLHTTLDLRAYEESDPMEYIGAYYIGGGNRIGALMA